MTAVPGSWGSLFSGDGAADCKGERFQRWVLLMVARECEHT